jgi:hypothetical protein
VLTSDLREFIASGMLTLKAKFETLEEGKIVSRAAEVWSFFWAQVLPVSDNNVTVDLTHYSIWKVSSCPFLKYEICHRRPSHYPAQTHLNPFQSDISSYPDFYFTSLSRSYHGSYPSYQTQMTYRLLNPPRPSSNVFSKCHLYYPAKPNTRLLFGAMKMNGVTRK